MCHISLQVSIVFLVFPNLLVTAADIILYAILWAAECTDLQILTHQMSPQSIVCHHYCPSVSGARSGVGTTPSCLSI